MKLRRCLKMAHNGPECKSSDTQACLQVARQTYHSTYTLFGPCGPAGKLSDNSGPFRTHKVKSSSVAAVHLGHGGSRDMGPERLQITTV